MREQSLYRRIIAGQTGSWSAPLRAALSVIESCYAAIIDRRNRAFDQGEGVFQVEAPVVSIGNLTVGGTGKTPMVIHTAGRLERMGSSPAVVARGYGAVDGAPNDEECLIRSRVPGVSYVADRDRVRGAEYAVRRFGADVVILDDGFQHRRLARDLDVVLIDASCPFGFERLLPRGWLREPVASLSRADVVIVTRCDQASADALDRIVARIQTVHPGALVLKCRHRVVGFERMNGTPVTESVHGLRAVAFAAIARPAAFLTTLQALGMHVVGTHWFPDHHAYSRRDVDRLLRGGRFPAHAALVTTEKDAVKLRALSEWSHANLLIVRVAVDFIADDGTIFDSMLARIIEPKRARGLQDRVADATTLPTR